jgi:hypothetical protein
MSEHLYPSRPGNWWIVDGKLVEYPEGKYPPQADGSSSEYDAEVLDTEQKVAVAPPKNR